jgi:hypothetical protein
MSRTSRMLSFAAIMSLVGAVSVNVAFAADQPQPTTQTANTAVPLPQDRQDALMANPASPNCYPDINHCASYSSGDVSKNNPIQQPQQQQPAQQGKKSQ